MLHTHGIAAPPRLATRRRVRDVSARAEPPTRRERVEARAAPRSPPRRRPDEEDDEDFLDDEDEWSSASERRSSGGGGRPPPPPSTPGWLDGFGSQGKSLTASLVAAAFVLGVGLGVGFDTVSFEKDNIASSVVFDRSSPNSGACATYGASAVVFDQRVFLSFNPFNVYVTQPEVKPGCVLRRSNWAVLESRSLVKPDVAENCKRHLNTLAFVGNLEGSPEVSCVYHSEQAENAFLNDPESAVMGDGNVQNAAATDAAAAGGASPLPFFPRIADDQPSTFSRPFR